ncbi:MAG: hypothetical protein ACK5V3_09720, partial [Bdellovibrionales bacterium]
MHSFRSRLKAAAYLLTALLTFISLSCHSSGSYSPTGDAFQAGSVSKISTDLENLTVQYGGYTEIPLSLGAEAREPIAWGIAETELPPGLNLEMSTSKEVVLFGTPLMVGRWCFNVTATSADQILHQDQLCLISKNSETSRYPYITSSQYLSDAILNTRYQAQISLETQGRTVQVSDHKLTLPRGLTLRTT